MKTMKTNPKKQIQNQDTMCIDQQIKHYEEKIASLEENGRQAGGNPGQVEKSLNETYEQIALLKIRKMMGY